MDDKKLSRIANDLDAIKKLMIFQLLEKGFSQSQLASALGVSQPTISRMLPKGGAKRKSSIDE
ncbi:MAG: helix-turn-helix domain-containing protein [Phyllobacteriaceae bacterium]|nr:helix-turn-helix domain-containing protein [Phyllobacteriaceae bacterium]